MLGCLLPAIITLASERRLASGLGDTSRHTTLQRACTAIVLIVPHAAVLWADAFPPLASGAIAMAMVTAMKLHSYHLVNRDVRRAREAGNVTLRERIDGVEEPIVYPYNLTFSNLFYFLAAPTLW